MSEDIGKVSRADLAAHVFGRTGATDDAVLQGPAYGEDAAAIRVGGEILVVSTDPISLAASRVGSLGVDVACNDVAASGATPRWLTACLFLPDADLLDPVTAQIHEAALRADVAVVGGHSEYTPELSRPTVTFGAMGLADRYVPTGGAEAGDHVLLTKGAAVEGSAILATDFRDDLADEVPAAEFETATGYFDDISVRREAAALSPLASAMHDPTEGGVLAGLVELAAASGVGIDIERESVPVRGPTARLCSAAGVDPLRVFGSGALLATVPEEAHGRAVAAVEDVGVDVATIGRVVDRDPPGVVLDGDRVEEPVRDEMYALWG